MIKKYEILGACCAACAAKIESKIAKIDGVNKVALSHAMGKILLDFDESRADEILAQAQAQMSKVEPGMKILF
ncbi:cation transporter [Campylobacter suis]|uniref:HMA domain-containing protein n=1 Tax=Campylobacter suis TaxID=2790657 RepID=A0ABN7KC28_9BACT|nr:cation transporter [Campylobacter suis]CAD7289313.1 hypothetical protein LMG8286_01747 [Campylobacter suis]